MLLFFSRASGAPAAYTLQADTGAFGLSGQTVALRATRQMIAAAGSFAQLAQTAALRVARQILAAADGFTLTGQDVGFSVSPPIVNAYRLTAGAAAFALAGQNVGLVYDALTPWRRVAEPPETWIRVSD